MLLQLLVACPAEPKNSTTPSTPTSEADAASDADTDADSDSDSDADSDTDSGADSGATGPALQVAAPSYAYPDLGPGGVWQGLIDHPDRVGITIINPNSGPGDGIDSAYASLVPTVQATGIKVLGYVSTQYGNRDPDLVLADIDTYRSWYGVDGIFLDEGPGTGTCTGLTTQYQSYADAAHAFGTTVAMNAGTDTCESYLDFLDVVILFENDAGAYANYTAPTWMTSYAPDRFWLLAYAVPDESTADTIAVDAAAQGFGWVYLTDDVLPNPWDTLPSWWEGFLASLP